MGFRTAAFERFVSAGHCFVRFTGTGISYIEDVGVLDRTPCPGGYLRVTTFGLPADRESISRLQKSAADLAKKEPAFGEMMELYHRSAPNSNSTIETNLAVSAAHWYELYGKRLGKGGRFVCSGRIGYKGYLFCYMLFRMGISVGILLPEGDLKLSPVLLRESKREEIGQSGPAVIPAFSESVPSAKAAGATVSERPRVAIPPHPRAAKAAPEPVVSVPRVRNVRPAQQANGSPAANARQELSYEQLAALAESVVMVAVCDEHGDIKGNGSGIAIGRKGYILTNCHVVSKGPMFLVRLENDERAYPAFRIIKYHSTYDMALIKIERELRPLPVYSGAKELVRGQKVVAIGSPMGLFNTVSDGIISGFRRIDDMDMIQFTAPISQGSSGGALLNVYGEVIGMSTASIDKGQNMNLAVGYKQILPFIRGFV